jgi:hypothetical protein
MPVSIRFLPVFVAISAILILKPGKFRAKKILAPDRGEV